jgi:uncharacterized Ntn-hydrolase superfamily protein
LPELHTFSIVAHCPRTGMLGVSVASAIPCVGSISAFAAPEVGAIATQAWCNPYFGTDGLALLKSGRSSADALRDLLAADERSRTRQLWIVDKNGESVAWTGEECAPWAGHRVGHGFAVQGNMLAGQHVLVEMEAAFLSQEELPLADRLVASLRAVKGLSGILCAGP